TGARTTVRPRIGQGQIVLTVPAAVVHAAAYPVVLDPLISPELGMDQPVFGPASGEQWAADVAFDGTNYLVVWDDLRGSSEYISGTRVAPNGTALDPYGVMIMPSYGGPAPRVAWGGGVYLVAASYGGVEIWGARVAPGGTPLDPTGFPINL